MLDLDVSSAQQKVGTACPQFVSRYQVQLPGKEEIAAFLHRAVEELGGRDE